MRLPSGGRIDRSRPLRFYWNGQMFSGFAGDTLASALLASGPRIVSRSVNFGRPRGIYAAGVEEPNAYVQVLISGSPEPMLRATCIDLFEGLEATSLNGKGRAIAADDSALFDKAFAHCDVLVIGGGPAGVRAAIDAGNAGRSVILVDDHSELLSGEVTKLGAQPEADMLLRATAVGCYADNCVFVAQQREGGQRLWQIRAGEVVIATGALERPIVFANNDLPGIMLAGAIRTYLQRFAVVPGERIVLFTNNDSAYAVAAELLDSGVPVTLVVDTRGRGPDLLDRYGVPVLRHHAVVNALGGPELRSVQLQELDGNGAPTGPVSDIECDVVGVSGGFNPALNLFHQSGGRATFDAVRACFVPDLTVQAQRLVGAAAGDFGVDLNIEPTWMIPAPDGQWNTHFVDLERDTTVSDLQRGIGAGLRSVEHLKRYTSFGTGSDQGKTSSVITAATISAFLGNDLGPTGTPTARAPYVPVAFGLLAGRNRGELYDPVRVTPIHDWHVANGAVFEDVGQWKRPRYYPRAAEDMHAAVVRECRAAREQVGIIDASTLGKIELQGPDAAQFLNRMYTNAFDNLAIGAIRYGVMCRADGMIFDDGVVMRLGADRFETTTTTGNAAEVLEWMEEWLQTEWPTLRVRLTSVTDHWAAVAVVGPRSRDVVRQLTTDIDVEPRSFPFMQLREGTVAGVPARVCRVTYSGELAFELHTPAWYGLHIWQAVMKAGQAYGITPYGTETMHVLRAEKGYIVVGHDTDGTVTPIDAGMSWVVSKRKPDFVGRRSLTRSDTQRVDRKHLIGLLPLDPTELLPEGGALVVNADGSHAAGTHGHVTSSYYSAALGRTFALGLLQAGRQRIGTVVYLAMPGRTVAVKVVEPVFYDPENRRRDG